jgi:hypothetical protein
MSELGRNSNRKERGHNSLFPDGIRQEDEQGTSVFQLSVNGYWLADIQTCSAQQRCDIIYR